MGGARGSFEAGLCATKAAALRALSAVAAFRRERPWAAGAIALAVALNILVAGLLIAAPRVTEPLDPRLFVHEQGQAWTTAGPGRHFRFPYRMQWDGMLTPRRSNAVLLDNGKPLGPAHMPHGKIREAGAGGYSFWSGDLYFSTADNSDPRTNGHNYAIRFQAALNIPLLIAVTLADALLFLAWWRRVMIAWPRPVAAGDTLGDHYLQLGFFIAIIIAVTAEFAYDHGTGDMSEFLSWADVLSQHGPFAGYTLIKDYPPVGPFLLWCADRVGSQFGLSNLVSVKLMIAASEAAAGFIVMRWQQAPLAGMMLYLLVVPFGTMLGYIDALYAPFVLLLVIFLEKERLGLALLAITIAASIKWQAAILGPFVVLFVISRSGDLRSFAARCAPAALYALFVLAAFGPVSVATAFAEITRGSSFSANALNLNWIVTFVIERAQLFGQHLAADRSVHFITTTPPGLFWIMRAIFFLVYGASLLLFMYSRRTLSVLLLSMLVGYVTYFTINPRVHENHLFPALILGFVCYRRGEISALQFSVLALIAVIDPVLFYGINGSGLGFPKNTAVHPTLLFSLIEVGLFGLLWRQLVLRLRAPAVEGGRAATGEQAPPVRQRA